MHNPSLGVFENHGRLFDAKRVRKRLLGPVYSQVGWIFAFISVVSIDALGRLFKLGRRRGRKSFHFVIRRRGVVVAARTVSEFEVHFEINNHRPLFYAQNLHVIVRYFGKICDGLFEILLHLEVEIAYVIIFNFQFRVNGILR